jgi:LacI family transcriptional regulator
MPRSANNKNKSAVTVRDVAERAGVHPATVSRVLDPASRHRISDATARRVEKAVKDLGYETNSAARAMKLRRSFTVGVMIPDVANPLFPPMVRAIEDYLDPLGYTALMTNTDSDPERERHKLKALSARQVEGLIMAPSSANTGLVEELINGDVPVVLVNRSIDNVPGYAVTPDDRRGAASAVDHLISLGHHAIAHLAGPQDLSPGQERLRGFRESMRDHGLEVPDSLVVVADAFTGGAGVEPMRQLLDHGERFTAVFAGNDLLALDCIHALKAAGLRCPEDVSVIGFNDMPFADQFTPPLTTIGYSYYDMGKNAAEMLMGQIAGTGSGPRTLVLSTELVVRGSTAPPQDSVPSASGS